MVGPSAEETVNWYTVVALNHQYICEKLGFGVDLTNTDRLLNPKYNHNTQ
jgi:hypothetical protein